MLKVLSLAIFNTTFFVFFFSIQENPFFNRLHFHFIFLKNREKQINKWQYRQPKEPAQLCDVCKSMNFTDEWQHNFSLFSPLGPCVQSSADNNNNTCGAILTLFTIKKNEFHRPEIMGHCYDYIYVWNVIWLASLVFSHRLYLFFV